MPAPLDSPAALAAALAAIGCVAAAEEAALLWEASGPGADLATMVARRAEGVPLEVLLGYADFGGVRLAVADGVFLPRPRSELLARLAVERARLRGPGAVVADLCCGTGAFAAVVASSLPEARVVATDVDPTAVACAAVNGSAYGFEVVAGDLCAGLPSELRGRIDVLVANVPHVPTDELPLMPRDTRASEPAVAHDGGDDGLDVLRRLAEEARPWLRHGGVLLMEVADRQAAAAASALEDRGYQVSTAHDPDERTTVVEATAVARR